MTTIKAYYDGATLFPIDAINLPRGTVVNLSIDRENSLNPDIAKKLAQLAAINRNLESLNETEPLSQEFDDILAQRVNFSRKLGL
jgi:hypothetical protein